MISQGIGLVDPRLYLAIANFQETVRKDEELTLDAYLEGLKKVKSKGDE